MPVGYSTPRPVAACSNERGSEGAVALRALVTEWQQTSFLGRRHRVLEISVRPVQPDKVSNKLLPKPGRLPQGQTG